MLLRYGHVDASSTRCGRAVPAVRGRILRPLVRFREMRFPTFPADVHESIADLGRLLPLRDARPRRRSGCSTSAIPGAFAEVGVWRGETSAFLHRARARAARCTCSTPSRASRSATCRPGATTAASATRARRPCARRVGPSEQRRAAARLRARDARRSRGRALRVRAARPRPATSRRCASLEFFYPRLSPGGYLVMHDYNNAESDWACKRAFDAFLRGQARAARRARRRVGLGADPPAGLTPADPAPHPRAALRAGRRRRPHARVLPLPAARRAGPRRAQRLARRCRDELALADSLRAVGVENWVARRPADAGARRWRAPSRPSRPSSAPRSRGRCARSRCACSGRGCARWPSGRCASGGPTWWSSGTTWPPRGRRDLPPRAAGRADAATTSPGAGTSRGAPARGPARARRAARRGGALPPPRAARAAALPHRGGGLDASRPTSCARSALTRVELIPTGVDTRELRPAPEPRPGPPRLLFTGTMSYPPNHQGIRWFAARGLAARARAAARTRGSTWSARTRPTTCARSTARDGISRPRLRASRWRRTSRAPTPSSCRSSRAPASG